MGVITVLLYSTGHLHGEFHVPGWVALSCYIAIGLGTLTGGWRIIETMGTRSRSSRSIRDLSLGRRVDLLSGVLPAFPSRRPTPSQVA
jgi:phosphate/sulfate permease